MQAPNTKRANDMEATSTQVTYIRYFSCCSSGCPDADRGMRERGTRPVIQVREENVDLNAHIQCETFTLRRAVLGWWDIRVANFALRLRISRGFV